MRILAVLTSTVLMLGSLLQAQTTTGTAGQGRQGQQGQQPARGQQPQPGQQAQQGQGQGVSGAGLITTTFTLKHLLPKEAVSLLIPYLRDGRGQVVAAGPTSVTAKDSREGIDQMRRLLAEQDRAYSAITLNFELIQADSSHAPSTGGLSVDSILRSVLRFNSYRLLGRSIGTASEGSEFKQTIAIDSTDAQYSLNTNIGAVHEMGAAATVRLTVTLWRRGSEQAGRSGLVVRDEIIISTGLDVPLGQSVVLGTTAVRGQKGALVLVVRPELLATKR